MKSSLKREVLMGKYKKPKWAVRQVIRSDGMVEDICKCGVGHPNAEWVKENVTSETTYLTTHGCCGCCIYGKPLTLKQFAKMIGIKHETRKPKKAVR